MKFLILFSFAITAFAQSVVTVDPLNTIALESIPDLANIGEISPASTASRIILNSSTDCATASDQIHQAGYKVAECT